MQAVIVTHDLKPERWRLMPWRTVIEVARRLPALGFKTSILSLGSASGAIEVGDPSVSVVGAGKQYDRLADLMMGLYESRRPDVLFWPVTLRQSCRRLAEVSRLEIPVVSYFPGGLYRVRDSLYAMRRIGVRATAPYLLESLSPKQRKIRCFARLGVGAVLTMTQETGTALSKADWPAARLFIAEPGREQSPAKDRESPPDLPDWASTFLGGEEYLLFAGPPTAIRGVFELLDAFDMAAKARTKFKLICLFRSDPGVDMRKLERRVAQSPNGDRILAVWKSVDPPVMSAFLSQCRAAVFPFLLVPSEIPLAIIELLAWGKPAITTRCGGTGAFVRRFGLTVPVGNVEALADALVAIVKNEGLHTRCCEAARLLYQEHPTWDQTAQRWRDAALCAFGQMQKQLPHRV